MATLANAPQLTSVRDRIFGNHLTWCTRLNANHQTEWTNDFGSCGRHSLNFHRMPENLCILGTLHALSARSSGPGVSPSRWAAFHSNATTLRTDDSHNFSMNV